MRYICIDWEIFIDYYIDSESLIDSTLSKSEMYTQYLNGIKGAQELIIRDILRESEIF